MLDIKHKIRNFQILFWHHIAYFIPKKIVYYCAIRLMNHATTGKYSNTCVVDLTVLEALRRWDSDKL